jgi:hypothetical protein
MLMLSRLWKKIKRGREAMRRQGMLRRHINDDEDMVDDDEEVSEDS